MRLNGGRRWGMLHPWKKFTADVPRQGSPPLRYLWSERKGGCGMLKPQPQLLRPGNSCWFSWRRVCGFT
jgi:hypothetical protein